MVGDNHLPDAPDGSRYNSSGDPEAGAGGGGGVGVLIGVGAGMGAGAVVRVGPGVGDPCGDVGRAGAAGAGDPGAGRRSTSGGDGGVGRGRGSGLSGRLLADFIFTVSVIVILLCFPVVCTRQALREALVCCAQFMGSPLVSHEQI